MISAGGDVVMDGLEWLRAAAGRIDFSGREVIATAFAKEKGISINARGTSETQAIAALQAKARGSDEIKSQARARYAQITTEQLRVQIDRELEASSASRAERLIEQHAMDVKNHEAAKQVKREEIAGIKAVDEPSEVELQRLEVVKQELASLTARGKALADQHKNALAAITEARAQLASDARSKARQHPEAKKYQRFLELMGAWHED